MNPNEFQNILETLMMFYICEKEQVNYEVDLLMTVFNQGGE